jgi:hypothetical protein
MSRSTDKATEADAATSPDEPVPAEALETPAVRPHGQDEVATDAAPAAEPDIPGQGQDEIVEDAPAQETQAPPTPPEGHVSVTYHGVADLIELGAYKFRPGQPVYVPSDLVEELLTWPNERFVRDEPEADEE